MSTFSEFEFEEPDIVRLKPEPGEETMGWVNVGVHAVQIMLDREGNLTIEVEPRTNEGAHGYEEKLYVPLAKAMKYGGVNPDLEGEAP